MILMSLIYIVKVDSYRKKKHASVAFPLQLCGHM
jgi:hypothetical protein